VELLTSLLDRLSPEERAAIAAPCQRWPMRSNWKELQSSRCTHVSPQAPNSTRSTQKKRS